MVTSKLDKNTDVKQACHDKCALQEEVCRAVVSRSQDPEEMKNKVRTLRIQKDLPQGQLAEAVGVSRQTINSIENERYTPSLPLALALARFFGVTVEEMFDDR